MLNQQQQEQMRKIQADPVGAGKEMQGFDIPPELARNPEAMVRHLINSGQVSNEALNRVKENVKRIMPFMQFFGF